MPKKRGGGESSSFGLANLRRDLHLNRIFRQQSTSGGFSQPSDLIPSCGASVSSGTGGLHLPSGGHARRESFLYKASTDDREILACRPVSRASSVASNAAVDHPHGDDLIVTPFAQILASLRNVRNSFFAVCNLQAGDEKYKSSAKKLPTFETRLSDAASQMALEAIDELDWCLEQLETVQTHRSVSEMASNKFRKLLNKELSHFAESSKSGGQISKFLINTYMDHDDEENNTVDVPSVECITNSLIVFWRMLLETGFVCDRLNYVGGEYFI
uniref:3',5'-cyclic-AMP phosphodiesterase n=1 Tax=Steinernema glaseri TaxID=37863 RepID=A0A1I8A4C6_9BILA